ncbi:MAG: Gfo/Idh/MocA family oxidoreductase [Actinomycetota bacterium]|nr:Gfo/Idh/MocA family oxidoreductase [Actinomycetota bacterium]
MTAGSGLGLGIIGAGGFAQFVASATSELSEVTIVAVTDLDAGRAGQMADAFGADALTNPAALLGDDRVHAVVITTPPSTHARLSLQALAGGRHVFCEKPVALAESDADEVRKAVLASQRTFVVDHVLRYNPVLAALRRLQDADLLGAVHRLAFENDASDEDLPAEHWFWDDKVSGGILLEHGVHFFDAAAMLIGAPALQVQAMGSTRTDGRTDTVVCTVAHAGGALATYSHGFSHAHRAERQLLRLDAGLAEARVHGWIPLRAELDVWTDRVDAFEELPAHAADILVVPGVRPSGREHIAVTVDRNAAPAAATRARGAQHCAPHHVSVCIDLGGPDAKQAVYRESVRAALLDLATCARTGAVPRANIELGHAAVLVAAAGTRALHDGLTHHLATTEAL